MKKFTTVLALSILVLIAGVSCSKSSDSSTTTTADEDSSASGAAASAVGGALASSDSSGTVAMNDAPAKLWSVLLQSAFASGACPKVTTTAGQGCTQNGNAADIVYSSCSFGSSTATWTGTLEMTLSSGTAVNCGTFPATGSIANGQSIQRQFVASGAASTGTRTSARGTAVTIDNSSANLANFDTGTTITANIGSGYGSQVVFDGAGARKQVIVNQRIYSTGFDHSVTANINLTEASGTRTITTGTVKVYHNKLRVVGTSTFTGVKYDNTCCTPISGSITTAFAAGAHVTPTVLGLAVVGKSETLTFNSCGSATLAAADGTSSTVALTQCY